MCNPTLACNQTDAFTACLLLQAGGGCHTKNGENDGNSDERDEDGDDMFVALCAAADGDGCHSAIPMLAMCGMTITQICMSIAA